jgi:hypothetical protein
MSVVSVKVSPRVKKEMERLKDEVEWPSEIRKFIEDRLERARREESIRRVNQVLRTMPEVQRGTAAKLVRESRDGSR